MTPRSLFLALAAVAAFCGCSGVPKPEAPAGRPKRIVLVTIDTWRTDALGASGRGRVRTPQIDSMAKEGLFVPRAWSSATLTAPSHATILTGLEPYHHGIRDNRGFRLAAGVPTVATLLRDKGYATAAFVSAHPLARIAGLDSGFGLYDDKCAPGNLLSVAPRWRPGQETIEAASAWLRTAPERYFLWVHLYEPHDPYAPPEPYRSAYRDAPYFGEAAYVDELVGRLKAATGERGEKDAVWVISGDHGEALEEHGEATHGLFVYDQTARVPLIFWSPGLIPASRSDFARLVDIAPTILALSGITPPAGMDGRSLVAPNAAPSPRVAYLETMYPFLNFGAAPVRAVTDGRYKVIDVPRREIYDLQVDPAETENLDGRELPAEVASLRAVLAARPASPPPPSQQDSGHDADALKSLGYIGAGHDYPLGKPGMDPKSFAPFYRKLTAVYALCEARRFAEAETSYAELLAVFPRSAALLSELGLVEMALSKTSEAESHLRSALDRDPGNSHALLGLANIALGRRDYKAAEGILLEVLRLDPDDVEANFDLGALYAQNLGQPGKAVAYWQRFVDLQPGDPEAPRIRQLLEAIKTGHAPR